MADNYPELTPNFRQYNIGSYPVTTDKNYGMVPVRFLHGSIRSAITLDLIYENLTQIEIDLIRDHYRDAKGSFFFFQLPSAIWAGHSLSSNIALLDTLWKYSSQPEESQKTGGYVDVTVSLISVA
jgi:hypothetical protein